MADKRAYFKLDVGYLTNPKVAALALDHPRVVLLHMASIAYAAQHLTDGVFPVRLLLMLNRATDADAGLLYDSGLWVDLSNGNAEVHDFLEHQRSAAEVKNAEDKAKRAANARWNAPSMPEALQVASEVAMPREKEREKTTTSDFDIFWDQYPRKIAKGNAVKAYVKALKKTDAQAILNGLANYLPAWAQTEEKFIPHAATWLNGERWADQVAAPKPVDGPRDQWARATVVGGGR